MATANTGNLFEDAVSNVILILQSNKDTIGIRTFNRGDKESNQQESYIDVIYEGHEEEMLTNMGPKVKSNISIGIRIAINLKSTREQYAENELTRKMAIVSDIMRANVSLNGFTTDSGSGGEGCSVVSSRRAEEDERIADLSTAFVDINVAFIYYTNIVNSVV